MDEAHAVETQVVAGDADEVLERLDDPLWLLRRAYHLLEEKLGASTSAPSQ